MGGLLPAVPGGEESRDSGLALKTPREEGLGHGLCIV